jgi:hypothetical protein
VENRINVSVLVPGWNTAAFEVSEGPGTFGVRLPLGNSFSVEVGHLLDQIVVLQEDRTVWSDSERVLVAGYWDPGICGCGFAVVVFHGNISF